MNNKTKNIVLNTVIALFTVIIIFMLVVVFTLISNNKDNALVDSSVYSDESYSTDILTPPDLPENSTTQGEVSGNEHVLENNDVVLEENTDVLRALVDHDEDTGTVVVAEKNYRIIPPTNGIIGNAGLLPGTPIAILNSIENNGSINFGQCTIAFSVPGSDGFPWAITAGHCGDVGKKVYSIPVNGTFENSTFLGTIRKVSNYSFDTGKGDWSAIRLDPNAPLPASPTDIPLQISVKNVENGAFLCKNGSRTGYDCGPQGRKNLKASLIDNRTAKLDEVTLCSLPGDSGSPIYDNQGIVGVLSSSTASEQDRANGYCTENSGTYYTPMGDVVDQVRDSIPSAVFIDS